MSVDELRLALEELLRADHVRLYDFEDPDDRELTLEEALRVVADDRSWLPPTEIDRPETFAALQATDSGEAEYSRERDRHG